MKEAIYPGTFDPLTLGHLDVAVRAAGMYDRLYVSVTNNIMKKTLFTVEERVDMAREALRNYDNIVVESFDGLLVHHVKERGVKYIIRGLRAVSDFEYEFQMALMNRTLDNTIDTIFMMPSQKFIFLSSTMIKDVASHGGNVSSFVTENVHKALLEKYKK